MYTVIYTRRANPILSHKASCIHQRYLLEIIARKVGKGKEIPAESFNILPWKRIRANLFEQFRELRNQENGIIKI